ncbi:prepilin-type N-terminal cleavage/methylation domain-containing protein [Hydrogenophaga sp. A37]|uniref:prepilin-type N-terminal cleavage/methylation domain-containing protein n=1 Tax=Hydrogenophaga sp. A37 TaxID=1945864 RepID=UPI000985E3FF|nr:prepilin-type N-terminal cleavage/methylation domain-containing protein [Hydrogenophaga sp. A37]OOG84911.1 type II secretion system protein GspH [Hydrogenophaga sp. A37]
MDRNPLRASQGFTLLELLVVVSIVALATAGVSLSLRDTGAKELESEAIRLAALLESGRAQSRSSGVPVRWLANDVGFEFQGISTRAEARDSLARPRMWLNSDTRARVTQPRGADGLVLGPEPLITAQRLELIQGDRRLTLATDGLAPFAVVATPVTP